MRRAIQESRAAHMSKALLLFSAANKLARRFPPGRSSYDRHRTGADLRLPTVRLLWRRSVRGWLQPNASHGRGERGILRSEEYPSPVLRNETAPPAPSRLLRRIPATRCAPASTPAPR